MIDFGKLHKERKMTSELSGKDDGKSVSVAGWVYDIRDLGKIRFIVLRDMFGEIQVAAFKGKTEDSVYDAMGSVNRESVVIVRGKIVKSAKASGGREIVPEEFELVAPAEEMLPLDVSDFSKTDLPKRLDYRFLDFHTKKSKAIFRIQSTIASAFRDYFFRQGFIEMQPPCVISSSSEGGTDLFEVKYFDKKAYLAQSPQLYKQMLACSMERVFMITPVWRAEKHNTPRHLNEIRQMDVECAFDGQFETMKRLEGVVKYIVERVIKDNAEDLKLLGVELKVPGAKYLSFAEVVEVLGKEGIEVSEDLTPEAERKLCEIYSDDIVFVHSWPAESKPFYIMPKDEKADAELSEGFDALYKGIEISSGGQRIHLPDLLSDKIEAKGLDPKSFKDYIDSFRYGAPPHSGWSIGLERMTAILCGLENVKEGTMFPRDKDRLTP